MLVSPRPLNAPANFATLSAEQAFHVKHRELVACFEGVTRLGGRASVGQANRGVVSWTSPSTEYRSSKRRD